MAKNEIAQVSSFSVATIDDEFMASIQEEMAGLGSIPMETIKIPSGGGIAFEVPGDNPDEPDMAKELVGVIVYHHPQNSYWAQAYAGNNEGPDCFSSNGKCGTNTHTGEVVKCDSCPFNQYGTAVNAQGQRTKGKACKNLHRIFLLQEGSFMPVIINIPPTSIKALKEYFAKRVLLKGKKSNQIVTKITLRKASSADGITYSQCVFAKVNDLDQNTQEAIKPIIEMTKAMAETMNTAPVEMKKNASTPTAEINPFEDVPFEEVPF